MTDNPSPSSHLSKILTMMAQVEKIPVHISPSALYFQNDSQLRPLLIHIQQYPRLCWVDLYKFLLQATCGWAHLQSNTKLNAIQTRLLTEFATVLNPLSSEPVMELLDVETQLVRINLRPWKYAGHTADDLWNLMLKASKRFPNAKSLPIFIQRWTALRNLFDHCVISSSDDSNLILQWLTEIQLYIKNDIKIKDLPLVSHSSLYHSEYNPSYRLVWKNDLHF